MHIPGGISLFQIIAMLCGMVAFWISLKSLNEADAWNHCAPTLNVNQCPYQTPELTFKCQTARRQMDSFVRSRVQNFARKSPKQKLSFYALGATLLLTFSGYICYFFIPLNGQLCLAKIVNISAFTSYAICCYLIVTMVLEYNQISGPYGGLVCALHTTLPQQDFGDATLKQCFQSFHICQNAVLDLLGVGFASIAAVFHFIAFFSAVYDCHTQVDENDWGTLDDLPDDFIIVRPEPPLYLVETEKEIQDRMSKEKEWQQQMIKKQEALEKDIKKEEKLRAKEQKRQDDAAIKQRKLEEAKRVKYEKKLKKEQKRLAKIENKRMAKEEKQRQDQAEKEKDEDKDKDKEKDLKQQPQVGQDENKDKVKGKDEKTENKSSLKFMDNQIAPDNLQNLVSMKLVSNFGDETAEPGGRNTSISSDQKEPGKEVRGHHLHHHHHYHRGHSGGSGSGGHNQKTSTDDDDIQSPLSGQGSPKKSE